MTALADEAFVLLTTFRKSGEGVPTTVWIAADSESLLVTTPTKSGKLKRLNNNPEVTLQPCSRGGNPVEGSTVTRGTATVLPAAEVPVLQPIFARKYKLQFKIAMAVERIVTRGHDRRIIRISVT